MVVLCLNIMLGSLSTSLVVAFLVLASSSSFSKGQESSHDSTEVEAAFGSSIDPDDIQEGDDVYFQCQVRSPLQADSTSWSFNGVEIEKNLREGVIISKDVLVLQQVSRSLSGSYTCTSTNTEGSTTSSPAELSVKYSPRCRVEQTHVYSVGLRENTTVTCWVDSNPPATSYRWTFKNTEGSIDISSKFQGSELQYIPVSHLDYGTLLCWAINSVGRQRIPCTYTVIPAGKPDALTSCNVLNATEKSVFVSCEPSYRGDGGVQKSFVVEAWDEGVIEASNTSDNSVMEVSGLRPATRYTLKVFAVNSMGRSEPYIFTTFTLIDVAERRTAEESVCQSKMCRAVAARMLHSMDHGHIDPCEDFYQFSCGGLTDNPFLKREDPLLPTNKLIKESLAKADRNDTDLRELLVVYDSCRNYTNSHPWNVRIEQARNVFNSLGYQFNPISSNISFGNDFDLSVALAKMMKMHFAPIFDIMIDVNEDDRQKFDFKMTLPAFRSPFTYDVAQVVCYDKYKMANEKAKLNGEIFNINTHYNEYIFCQTRGEGLKARLNKMEGAVRTLDLASHIKNEIDNDQLILVTKTELNFMLVDISQVFPSPPEIKKQHVKKEFESYTLRQLDDGSVFSNSPIVFSKFFEELLGRSVNPDSTIIQVYFKNTFDEIFSILADVHDNTMMQNMMLMMWAERVYSDLVQTEGPQTGSVDYCLRAVASLMDDYVSYLYLKELPARESIQKTMKTLIERHIAEAKVQLEHLEHLESPAKEEFLHKLDAMTGEVATLEEMKVALLDIKKLTVTENNFIENYVSLLKRFRNRLYGFYAEFQNPAEARAIWSVIAFPYLSSGVTSYSLNKFLIPHGAMVPPFYYGEDVPGYINAAGIGHMISHEVMHAFDSTGVKYNYSGKRQTTSEARLLDVAECLKEELFQNLIYNTSSGFQSIFSVDPDLLGNELLVDSFSAKLSWDAYIAAGPTLPPAPNHQQLPYLTQFTRLQLYYIKLSQNHCSAISDIDIVSVMESEYLPPKLRVNMMLRHDLAFAEAFQCFSGSYMVSESQCQIT